MIENIKKRLVLGLKNSINVIIVSLGNRADQVEERIGDIRDRNLVLTSVAQLIACCSTKQKVAGSIPGQGTCLGCLRVPSLLRA